MVIRTKYQGQRYSMGSSDPLPAGFEIRFGSLNLGNGYLMRIINCDKLHPRRSTGPGPVPSRPLLKPRRPPKRTLWALQHLNADDAPVSSLDRRGRNDDGPFASPRNATRSLTKRQPLRWGGACGLRAAVPPRLAQRHNGARLIRLYRRGGARESSWPSYPSG
jgi:hypothetical protein